MGTRRKSREIVMQMLFQGDLGKQSADQVQRLFWESHEPVDDDVREFAEDLYRIAIARQEEIDTIIEKHAQNWRIERMPVVDRNLLRAAIAEMLGFPKTPHAVVINESLEVARRYTETKGVSFLNGVLDAVARELLEKRLAV